MFLRLVNISRFSCWKYDSIRRERKKTAGCSLRYHNKRRRNLAGQLLPWFFKCIPKIKTCQLSSLMPEWQGQQTQGKLLITSVSTQEVEMEQLIRVDQYGFVDEVYFVDIDMIGKPMPGTD